jgi:hypothetical protein
MKDDHMTNAALPMLPGRLGTYDMQLRDDPRADPRMLAAMASLGLDVAGPPPPTDASAPIEHLREFAAEAEAGFGAAFAARFRRCTRRRFATQRDLPSR